MEFLTGKLLASGSIATMALSMQSPSAFARAAEQAADEKASAGSDIVVTAGRREERLQDVPISVTARSGDALKERNIATVADLQFVAPR